MRWRKTDKAARLARQIVETKLDRITKNLDDRGTIQNKESIDEYLRRGGRVVKLPPR